MPPRKSGFARYRRPRRRPTFGDRKGGTTTVFRIEVVAELPDVRERMRLVQRRMGMPDSKLAEQIGVTPQAFCQMWRRRRISDLILSEIERVLGVTRDYWTAPLERPVRVPPKERLAEMMGRTGT